MGDPPVFLGRSNRPRRRRRWHKRAVRWCRGERAQRLDAWRVVIGADW